MTADISIFDGTSPLRIDKPLRLIELFAGYGSQALALKYLGIPFEHHRISEWAIKSIYAYKELHATDDNCDYSVPFTDKEIRKWFYGGRISSNYNDPIADDKIDKMPIDELRRLFNAMQATNNKGSVVGVKAADLKITDTDKYTYLMTYSFPCQDLSKSGKQQGMSRDSNTRSGMLWQVERILFECKELGNLPQILLMENVPDVVGTKNFADFQDWIASLDSLGYRSYWQILNATEFGIPQNRKRCYMVSVQGDHYYDFPHKIGCEKRLKDVLEKDVGEEYYLSDDLVRSFMRWSDRHQSKGDGFKFQPQSRGGANRAFAITSKAGSRQLDNYIDESPSLWIEGNRFPSEHEAGRVYNPLGISRAIKENHGEVATIKEQQ